MLCLDEKVKLKNNTNTNNMPLTLVAGSVRGGGLFGLPGSLPPLTSLPAVRQVLVEGLCLHVQLTHLPLPVVLVYALHGRGHGTNHALVRWKGKSISKKFPICNAGESGDNF